MNPYQPGDIRWHDFIYIFTYTAGTTAIAKGQIVTTHSDGTMVAPTTASGLANLTTGVFQALQKADAGKPVQCAVTGSRIILTADANLEVGNGVALKGATTVPEANRVRLANTTLTTTPSATSNTIVDTAYIGRIVEILTTTNGAKKSTTAAGDQVVVEIGRA